MREYIEAIIVRRIIPFLSEAISTVSREAFCVQDVSDDREIAFLLSGSIRKTKDDEEERRGRGCDYRRDVRPRAPRYGETRPT